MEKGSDNAQLTAKWEKLLTLAKHPNDQGIPHFLVKLFKQLGVERFEPFTNQVLAKGRHNSSGNVREEKVGKENEDEELYSILLSSYNLSRLQKLFKKKIWRDFYRFYKHIMVKDAEELKKKLQDSNVERVVPFIYEQLIIAA